MISGKLAGELLRTAALGTVLLLSACGGRPVIGGDPALSVVPTGVLPAPTQRDYQLETSPYFVGPFDRLIIDVYGVKDLTGREVQVDASGQVSFPLVGLLRVSGKTPVEIEQDLVERLRKAYGWLEGALAGKTWACGEDYSLADAAASTSLFYADWVLEITDDWPVLRAYRQRLLKRPSFARCVEEARYFRPFFPLGAPDRD